MQDNRVGLWYSTLLSSFERALLQRPRPLAHLYATDELQVAQVPHSNEGLRRETGNRTEQRVRDTSSN